MNIFQSIPLKKLNTFALDVKAKYYTEIVDEKEIPCLIENETFRENKRFILGAGSNVLFTQDFDGLVVLVSNRGIKILEQAEDYALIEAGAGEFWNEFVIAMLKSGFYGLENLAMIPGKVGAAAIQNIGAYGVEQKDFLHSVKGYRIEDNEFPELPAKECDFSYRSSIFKSALKDNFVISSVLYKLLKKPNVNSNYKDIKNEIEKDGIKNPDPHYIFNCVSKIRGRKLPDPSDFPNAGSYFKNPIIKKELLAELKASHPDIPYYEMADSVKIPAAWLIEKCNMKGTIKSGAGVWKNHSLVLVNYGTAKPVDIINLANEIKSKVFQKFSINLVEEVILI
ncbi:MAG: UDP-N-acetylmuramate dehydrogenase [Ignavibacteria bacterium]|nr:UDP-N-acetylmuramate dehydrogenase [Ignavibacteria bacterium]